MAFDFTLSDELLAVQDAMDGCLERFKGREKELHKMVLKDHVFPQELWDAVAETGLLGCVIPEEYGGTNMGLSAAAVGIEALAKRGYGNALLILTIMDAACIARNGSEEMKQRYLPGIATGELKFCFAITEPNAGSNTFRLETLAERDGDHYIVNGQKTFITGIDVADKMVMICRTTSRKKVDEMGLPKGFGLAVFAMDTKLPGITLNAIPTHGIEGLTQYEVFFDNVRVPVADLVGEPDMGGMVMFNSLNPERILAAAAACGMSQRCITKAVDYANERKVFKGKPIGTYQGISHPLAKCKINLEASKLLMYKAAWMYDQPDSHPGLVGSAANHAKYFAAETAIETVDRAIQTHGGYGFSEEYGIIYYHAAARLMRTAPVTAEQILNFVAEHDLGLPRSY